MNEYEIAVNKVLPYLKEKLKWPEKLISSYGRVPVQIGSSTIWADFVCYYSNRNKFEPWLLVEVKREGIPLETAIPQAESYSLILGAKFFCVTDGNDYNFFATGHSQGKNIQIRDVPLPTEEFLVAGIEGINFPDNINNLVDLFLIGLKTEQDFLEDTQEHFNKLNKMNNKIFKKIDSLTKGELKECIESLLMLRTPNKKLLFNEIDEDFGKVKNALKYILESKEDPIIKIQNMLDKNGELYLKGAGIFVITQLFASAFPNEYIVLEDNISKCLRFLGITDVLVTPDTANGYVYINEICKTIYIDKMKYKLKNYDFGLVSVHNFLWHYYVNYKNYNQWS